MQFFRSEGPPSCNTRRFTNICDFWNLAIKLYQRTSNLEAGQISRFVIRSEDFRKDPVFATMHGTSALCKLPLKDRDWSKLPQRLLQAWWFECKVQPRENSLVAVRAYRSWSLPNPWAKLNWIVKIISFSVLNWLRIDAHLITFLSQLSILNQLSSWVLPKDQTGIGFCIS